MMDDRAVPAEFAKVPSSHWRNYPAAYGNKPGNPNPGNGNMGNGNMGNMKGHGNGNGRGNGKGGN
jgi:hypothetical protein